MTFGRALNLLLAIHVFSFIKHRIVLHKDCTEQNEIKEGKIWQSPHSTGLVTKYEESSCSEIKHKTKKFPNLP